MFDGCGAANYLIFHIDIYLTILLGCEIGQQMTNVCGVQLTSLGGQAAGEIGIANDGYIVLDHHLILLGQFTVTTLFRGQIHHHTTGLHDFDHIPGNQ